MFTRITVHRGIIHSVPASFFFWFSTTIILYQFFNFPVKTVWMAGFFVFWGVILHLLLDELVSLNFFKGAPKRSCGTAFKFGMTRDLKTTFIMYVVTALLFMATPDYTPFVRTYFSSRSLSSLHIFPEGFWFKNLYLSYLKP